MAFDWNDVHLFLAIHRGKSLTAAGKTLGADQSTVGRRLAAFEEKIGTKLFVRTPAGFVPTSAGERLALRAVRMEQEIEGIDREVVGAATALCGSIRVTAPETFGAKVVTPILADFQRQNPTIEVELLAKNEYLSLARREADIAIRTETSPGRTGRRTHEAGVRRSKVGELANEMFASRRYLEKRGHPRGDFSGHSFIVDDDRDWAASFEAAASAGTIVMRSNTSFVRLEAVRADLGIAFLPAYLVAEEPDIVRVGPAGALRETIWLVVHEDVQASARVRACIDFLTREIRARRATLAGSTPRSGIG